MAAKVIPVRVALRCRPLVPKETDEGCQTCLTFVPGEPQVILGADKAFTYDYVFTPDTPQKDVFENSVNSLVKGVFKGYNATVLAYGQTGSGKTYSMGGGDGVCTSEDDSIMGIIPRVIKQLFTGIHQFNDYKFDFKVSYLEIYKEDLLDLLVPPAKRDKDCVTIREDQTGIKIAGLTEQEVKSEEEMLKCLADGSHGRTTGATAMNNSSSRSHAIFTIYVDRTNIADSQDFCRAKFHLVDLAGSERQKKTHAEGERLKEGININRGLLALGNVISALGDEAQRAKHVPYRDSKLTRLLQDSLGGNSHTVMIACVSPADSNLEETLSTLRYADRARQIKNKPVVNRDPQVAEILRLKGLVQELQSQLYQLGKPVQTIKKSSSQLSLMSTSSPGDVEDFKKSIEDLKSQKAKLERDLEQAWEQNELLCAKVIVLETQKETLQEKLSNLRQQLQEIDTSSAEGAEEADRKKELIKSIGEQIEDIERTQNEDIEKFLHSMNEEHDTSSEDQQQQQTPGSSERDQEMNQKRLERKAQLNRDLAELNKKLDSKEQLFKQLGTNSNMISEMKHEYEENMASLNSQISKLTHEKEELETQLAHSKQLSAPAKDSKYMRIKELEQELTRFKKQVQESNRMLKMKEQAAKDMDKLKFEITSIKQQRVKLMRQIKEDNDNFRKWKQQKDKEVTQLKAKDRKRQVEITKLEQKTVMQQNILKRKNEEAAALSRRLKEAMMRQRQVAEDRAKKETSQDITQKSARLKKHLEEELAVLVDLEQARITKDELIKDRKEISEQLTALREAVQEEGPSPKRQQLNDSSGKPTDEHRKKMLQQIHELEQDQELKSASIRDLQERIMEMTGGNDALKRNKFENIKTLVDARVGLKHTLNIARDAQLQLFTNKKDNEFLKAENSELHQQVQHLQDELELHHEEADKEKSTLQKDHHTQTEYLLQQLKKRTPPADDDREKMLATIMDLEAKYQEKCEEHQNLLKDYTRLAFLGSSKAKREGSFYFSPSITKTQTIIDHKENIPEMISEVSEDDDPFEDGDEEMEESEDDDEMDADYQPGFTPVNIYHQRTNRKKSRLTEIFKQPPPVMSQDQSPVCCHCKSGCKTKKCKCLRENSACGSSCTCNGCVNQEPSSSQESQKMEESDTSKENSSNNLMNTTFVKDSTPDTSGVDTSADDSLPKQLPGKKRKLLGNRKMSYFEDLP